MKYAVKTEALSNFVKKRTQVLHGRTEKQVAQRLFSPLLNPLGYHTILNAMLDLHSDYEDQISGFDEAAPYLAGRRRSHLLAADLIELAALDGSTSVDKLSPVPAPKDDLGCETRPLLQSSAEALGALYVLEGSTMGGQVISRQLASHPWLDEERHLQFFRGYGSQTLAMWRQFTESLNHFGNANPDLYCQVSNGAEKVFIAFERAFSSLLVMQEQQIDSHA